MKRILLLLTFVFITINLYSCAELAAGLSNFNEANGAQCSTVVCDSELYHDGKYKDAVRTTDGEGNDVESSERQWVKSQANKYLYYSYGVYYSTSPYTGGEYRFTNHCESYY